MYRHLKFITVNKCHFRMGVSCLLYFTWKAIFHRVENGVLCFLFVILPNKRNLKYVGPKASHQSHCNL